jgi:hypothetical protein
MNSKLAKGGKTALLAIIGGVIGAGAKMLLEPALLKSQSDIPKKFWISPVLQMAVGAGAGAFDKTAIIGAGLVGAGTSQLWEAAGLAMSVKKNQAGAGTSANTSGFNTGALVGPEQLQAPPANAGALSAASPGPSMSAMAFDETGALIYRAA